ncbi:MAG: helix-turn-helix transcriptional regulator [bacterium]|nr:helix-turn-helix transcriptional regulator [bacterium]
MTTLHKINELLQKSKKSVRNERIALGLTQKEFANFVGLKYATYRIFEQEGKISLENFLYILDGLNKSIEYNKFLDGFEFENAKERARPEQNSKQNIMTQPIVLPSQKQITLDKQIFGNELFYSVENGHIYEISTFITILLRQYNDERILLLLRYFGVDRLKPYVLKEKNIDLLKKFNKHVAYLKKRA